MQENFTGSIAFTPHQVRSLRLAATSGLLIAGASVAAVAGGMKYFMIALAIMMAGWVYKKPNEGIAAGTIYLLACNVIFPHSARFDWMEDPWEMRYWAAGLLMITLAACAGVGFRNLSRIPAAVKVFLLVAVAAAFVGLSKGGSLSYVSRQFYGSLLLAVYFAIAYRIGDEELFLRRLRVAGLVGAFLFFLYYGAVFSKYGFHKEMTTLGTLEGVVALLCMAVGLSRKSFGWVVSGVITFAVPALLFWRHAVLMCVFGVLLTLAMKAARKKTKFALYCASAVLVIPSLFPAGAGLVLDRALNSTTIERVLPGGTGDITSLEDRVIQLWASLDVLQRSPLFGDGFGNEIAWDSVSRGVVAQAFVDNGWAYMTAKMGVLGWIAMGWFLFTVLRCVSAKSLEISVAVVALTLVAQFSEPVFFQFTTSPLCGALAGLLCAKRMREEGGLAAHPSSYVPRQRAAALQA